MPENWSSLSELIERRQSDWRVGPIVYQTIVDRFAPADDLESRAHLYASPRTLHKWTDLPHKGRKVKGVGLWSHELAFWGGNLASLRSRLDYLHDLGVDLLYLNPIHHALSNHKYDALDHGKVAPEYGSDAELKALADDLHARGMRLVLDGVFNHMGRQAERFQDALGNPASEWREWFWFGEQYPAGYRAWNNYENLPELNLENPAVRQALLLQPDAPLRRFLDLGSDGWRLDTANDLGPEILRLITETVHGHKPDAVVIGEAWNYPEGWAPPLDGILGLHLRQLLLELADRHHPPAHTARLLDRLIADMGIDAALRSWVLLDNHDTPRLHNRVHEPHLRRMLRVLQFALPGAPCIYYGSELDMSGGEDPEQRAPMRWDLAGRKNPALELHKELIRLRRSCPALRVGQFRLLDSTHLLAFLRYTHRAADSVFVVANPGDKAVEETLSAREPRIMNGEPLRDLLDSYRTRAFCGMFTVDLPPRSIRLLVPEIADGAAAYSAYKRVP